MGEGSGGRCCRQTHQGLPGLITPFHQTGLAGRLNVLQFKGRMRDENQNRETEEERRTAARQPGCWPDGEPTMTGDLTEDYKKTGLLQS